MSAAEPAEPVFAAIADPTRRRILEMLRSQPEAVQDIADRFDISRPAISRHLRVLTEAGLVQSRAEGRHNVYALQPEPFAAVRDWLDGFWNERLSLLKRISEGDA
ncbi:MAG: ArsR/SmtB family transcription factor [Phenylobacterium sp.]